MNKTNTAFILLLTLIMFGCGEKQDNQNTANVPVSVEVSNETPAEIVIPEQELESGVDTETPSESSF